MSPIVDESRIVRLGDIGLLLHYDRQQYLQAIVSLSPLPVIACHLGYSAEK